MSNYQMGLEGCCYKDKSGILLVGEITFFL